MFVKSFFVGVVARNFFTVKLMQQQKQMTKSILFRKNISIPINSWDLKEERLSLLSV